MKLADAFKGIQESSSQPGPRLAEPAAVTRPVKQQAPEKVGKSSNPEFEPVKIYLRRDAHKQAKRQLFDEDRDFSDLMQQLLDDYLGA